MVLVSAPAKIILIGENILFTGGSALAVALDLRLKVEMKPAEFYIVDGYKMTGSRHPYIMKAVEQVLEEDTPMEFTINSNIPSGLGLGSSTALTVATVAGLLQGREGITPELIARESFEVEQAVAGRAIPLDATTVASGAAIVATEKPESERALWRVHTDDRDWHFTAADVPDLVLVLGKTPRKSRSSEAIDKVQRFKAKSGFAKDIIKELSGLMAPSISALADQDLERLGAIMDKSHKLLNILGLNNPFLQKMVDAARRHSYGAKVAASGGGNLMVALTDKPDEVVAAIEDVRGIAIATKLTRTGVRIV
jgi:mevalonate kinase